MADDLNFIGPGRQAYTGSPSVQAGTRQKNIAAQTAEAVAPLAKPIAQAKLTAAELAAEQKRLELNAKKAAAMAKAEQAKLDAEEASRQIKGMLAHPGLKHVVGSSWSPFGGVFGKKSVTSTDAKGASTTTEEPYIPYGGREANDFLARYEQVKAGVGMGAREGLKGSGAITDYETAMATKARSRMNLSTSMAEFKKAAEEYEYYMNLRARKAQMAAMGPEGAKKELSNREKSFKILGSRPAGD